MKCNTEWERWVPLEYTGTNIRSLWKCIAMRWIITVLDIHTNGKPDERGSCTYRNTGADSYTAMKRVDCSRSRWKAANQSKD
jgi:hypothetical protein